MRIKCLTKVLAMPCTQSTLAQSERVSRHSTEYPRSLRILAFLYGGCAVVALLTPPLIPVTHPSRVVFWWISAVLSLVVAVSVTVRRGLSRRGLVGVGWLLFLVALILAFAVNDVLGLVGGLALSVSILALLAGQVSSQVRKALVASHVALSGIWLGIAVVFVTLTVIAARADGREQVRHMYELLEFIDMTILPWSSIGAITSGLAVSLTTKWGVVKHYWVFVKLLLAILVITCAFSFLHNWVVVAALESGMLPASDFEQNRLAALPELLVGASALAASNVLAATVISVCKPWGKTRFGRRDARRRARRRVAVGGQRSGGQEPPASTRVTAQMPPSPGRAG